MKAENIESPFFQHAANILVTTYIQGLFLYSIESIQNQN